MRRIQDEAEKTLARGRLRSGWSNDQLFRKRDRPDYGTDVTDQELVDAAETMGLRELAQHYGLPLAMASVRLRRARRRGLVASEGGLL